MKLLLSHFNDFYSFTKKKYFLFVFMLFVSDQPQWNGQLNNSRLTKEGQKDLLMLSWGAQRGEREGGGLMMREFGSSSLKGLVRGAYALVNFPQMWSMKTEAMKSSDITKTGTGPLKIRKGGEKSARSLGDCLVGLTL
jgi:hypothetical protein